MNPTLYVLLGLFLGCFLGFLLAAILTVGKRGDSDDEPVETHAEGDGARLVHLIAKRYSISRPDQYVALLEPETHEVAYIGTNLREVLDRSMEAAHAGHR